MNDLRLGYRVAAWRPVPAFRRWWPLAVSEFRTLFRSRWGVALFCFCLLPVVVRSFVLMIRFGVVNFGAGPRNRVLANAQALAQWDPARPDFYVEMVMGTWPGLPILVLLTGAVTAGAVARDRRTNALELLWTRGISPLAYLFAKWLGSVALVATVTVLGPLFLWCLAALMADDGSQWRDTLGFLVPMLGGLLAVTMVWVLICVLLSTLAAAPNQAIVTWCMLVVGTTAIAGVLALVVRDGSIRTWLSIWDAGGTVARALAGVNSRGEPLAGALFLLGVAAVLALPAARRLRTTEALG